MFRPARMRKLGIITLDDYSDSLISALHEASVVQIHDLSDRVKEDLEWRGIFESSRISPHAPEVSSLLMRITNITDFWKSIKKEKVSPLQLIEGFIAPKLPEKTKVDKLDKEILLENATTTIENVEPETQTIQKRLEQLEFDGNQLQSDFDSLKSLEFLDLDLSDLVDTENVSIISGKVALEVYPKFKSELEELTDKIIILEGEIPEETKRTVVIVILKKYREDLTKLLRKFEFEKFDVSRLSGKPKEAIKNVKTQLENIEKEKEDLILAAGDIAEKWQEKLLVLKEQLEIERQKAEIFSSFAKTDKTYMLEAWVREKDLDQAMEVIKESTEGHSIIDVKNPEGEDKVPVHLDNPSFAKPFEFLTKMYSPPQYNELDPTIIVALVFPFFFGFCLTDGLYGIFDVLIGTFLILGLGKKTKIMSDFGLVLIACGIWTLVMALITNGLMGDIFPTYLGLSLPTVIGSVDAFVNPQNILILALLCGIIYTILGFALGAYNNLHKGAVKEAIGDQICWLILILGILLVGAAYLTNAFTIYIGVGVAVVGLAILVYHNGAFGLMDVMGLVGQVFSFSRLLAACLATGGMAIAINIVAFKVVGMIPILGVILTALILIVMHPVNSMIQTLGAFIQSLRLHYVEFFSQFYTGQGMKFRPFRAKRKITTLE